MMIFEMALVVTSISRNGGPFVAQDRLCYAIPDEAVAALEPVMEPYGQSPYWYFDKLNYGRPPAPWAIACLDREYDLAGEVATARRPDSGIAFTPYTMPPDPLPREFIPKVGAVTFRDKDGLACCSTASPIFAQAWAALSGCPADRHWLAVLDPLPAKWVACMEAMNADMWKAHKADCS